MLPRRASAALVLTLAATRPSFASTWLESAQAELTCTVLATDAERAELRAELLPRPQTPATVAAYFRDPPRSPGQERLRYLTALAALAWSADRTNDQALRTQLYLTIGVSAQSAPDAASVIFVQISRCARTWLISSAVERGESALAVKLADDLAARYNGAPPGGSVEDWPLLLGMRELALGAETTAGVEHLAGVAAARAKALETVDPDRASRLYAAVAAGLLVLGKPDQATGAASLSVRLATAGAKGTAIWRAFPIQYDGLSRTGGPKEAATVTQAYLERFPLPRKFEDPENEFAVRLRLAQEEDSKGKYDEASRQVVAARAAVLDMNRVRHSIPFLRRALEESDRESDGVLDPASGLTGTQSWNAVVAKDPATAKRWYTESYRGSYDTILAQSQNMFISDARDQVLAAEKIDRSLSRYARFYDVLPEYRAEIQDRSFRLAQLRSYGRLTLATVAAALQAAPLDAASRPNVERFFTASTQNSTWLRKLWARYLVAPSGSLPPREQIWQAFQILDVLFTETTQAFGRYADFVRQKAPQLGALITPHPMALAEFQQLLRPGEAMIATLLTPDGLYVWGITRTTATLKRQPVAPAEVRRLVHDLRASLTATSSGGQLKVPPFDAAAAWEIYRLTFGSMPELLKGATHVFWYGHDALASVPPYVLVSAKPAQGRIATAKEFAQTRFLADLYPVSVLADLSLLRFHRQPRPQAPRQKMFLGIGAPMLSAADLDSGAGERVFDLAGGLDGKSLAELPKLPEAAGELRSLAATLGESRSTVWLGSSASVKQLEAGKPSDYQVIAFATHGFTSGEIQGIDEPALLLAPPEGAKDEREGLLLSREVALLHLDADLVVLSACNSATSDGRPRAEAFTGLSQAFFTAGARALMVSHWPVATGAAADLTVGLAEALKQDHLSLAAGLQQAVIKLRQRGGENDLQAHPFYWGPFVVVGDGAAKLPM
jgi:CHAT domain-containing protein